MAHAAISTVPYRSVICACAADSGLWSRLNSAALGHEEAGCRVFRCAPELKDLVSCCRRMEPAILIVDGEAVAALQLEEFRRMLAAGAVRVLVVSAHKEASAFKEFLRLGAAGVLTGQESGDLLKRAIQAISRGELWFPRAILSTLVRDSVRPLGEQPLTRRESEILRLICLGLKNREIAEKLYVSRETVRWHVRSIYSKLGVDGREAAMQHAISRELLLRAGDAPD